MNTDSKGLAIDLAPALYNSISHVFEKTAFRTGAGWGASLLEPSPFGEVAMSVITIRVAANETYKYYTARDYTSSSGIKIELNRKYNNDMFIFRTGSGTNSNLTPRPVTDALGISYSLTVPRNEKYSFTTMSAVNGTNVLRAVNDRPDHVSVFPVNMSTMPSWMASRANAEASPHPYTILLKSISLFRKKGESP